MNRIKTCIITGQYPPQVGGVGHSTHRIANLLTSLDMEIHVVAFEKHPVQLPFDQSCETTSEGDITVHRFKVFHPSPGPTPAADILTAYNRQMFEALDQMQRRHRFNLFHAFFLYPAGYIAGLVGRLHGVRTIASIRGNDLGKYAFDPLRLGFIRSALKNADYVTSVATNLIDFAHRAVTPISHKARTILNSVDLDRMRARAKPPLDLKGLVIGSSGLFRYKKGLHYLFQALSGMNNGFEYTLLLAGDFFSEKDREPHLREIEALGLGDRAVVTGRFAPEKAADYLQLFDILVYPSLYSEGCPVSMLEAMAMRKAIIASRSGAIPEIIRDQENGLLVNSGSSDELGHAIEMLVEKPDLRDRLAGSALKTAREMSPDRELAEWRRVYEFVEEGAHV